MTSRMEYENESLYKTDSPLSYDVEEGEFNPGSGRSSPGTIRDIASDCSTQTDDNFDHPQDRVTAMRIEVENTTSTQQTQTNQRTPQDIAHHISKHIGKKRQSDTRQILDSFYNRTNEQSTNTNLHSYQSSRPSNNTMNDTYVSPPLPNYPPPIRPPPPDKYITATNRTQNSAHQSWIATNPHNIRPNNLRFPYAVTPGINNRKSFFHKSTNEQIPTTTVMETIWFQEKDPRNLNNPHHSKYNPLLSHRNWSEMPFDSRDYNFVITPLHNLKDRVSEYFPPLPSEKTTTVKRSTKNMGRDKLHQSTYPILKRFYSLKERFMYDYNYEFKVPVNCTFDYLVAKASQDLSAYSVFEHQIFQLSFNFLHPTPKDVQNNKYRYNFYQL